MSLFIGPLLPCYIPRFTSGVTHTRLLVASMVAKQFPIHGLACVQTLVGLSLGLSVSLSHSFDKTFTQPPCRKFSKFCLSLGDQSILTKFYNGSV